jgi:EmrB/QacA subfamily drug resistance transporter
MVEDQAIAQRMRKRARRMRFVNVVMRRVLGLPIRTPLSDRLMLLFYTGRRSGRSYRQPVSYATDGDTLLTPGGGKWKLNLREGEPIAARVRGRKVRLTPTFERAPDEVVRLLGVMYEQNRRLTSFVPFIGDDGGIDRGQLANALDRGFCIVRWHVERGGTTSTFTDKAVASHIADSIGGAQHDPPVNHDRAPDAAPSTARTDRPWLVLAAVTAAGVVVTLDTTILNVAVPTIRRDLHTDLASLQWVLAGYSLTLGSLMVIGGKVGDMFGARRALALGAVVFAAGSLVASAATSVWTLVLGEAVIEGIGASLLFPASLATVSTVFSGPDRAKAFGITGGAAGAAAAFGPVVGGWLTTDYSWRWGFRINVVVAPLAALIALTVLPRVAKPLHRSRLDIPGALTAAAALFLLVFGITEGATYGWWTPTRAFTIGGTTMWPTSAPLSVAAAAFMLAVISAFLFVAIERRTGRAGDEPLVALGDFRLPAFRFGLTTSLASVMAQAGCMFVLAVFLQATHQLSAARTGVWLLPVGLSVLVGANVGGAIASRVGARTLIRTGIAVQAVGVGAAALVISPDVAFGTLAPTLALFGLGAGLGMSQLWNVTLSAVPPERSGSASGVTTTNNSIAAALGVAVLGTVLRAVSAGGATPARWALVTAVIVLGAGAASAAALPRRGASAAQYAAPEQDAGDDRRTGNAQIRHAGART